MLKSQKTYGSYTFIINKIIKIRPLIVRSYFKTQWSQRQS